MATRKFIAASAATPSTNPQSSAAADHAYALSLLNEWSGEQEKIYCVASGGKAYCDDSTVVQRNLFWVIEDIAESTALCSRLRGLINDLARAAGSDYVEGASHG